jgi:hypothetical protein
MQIASTASLLLALLAGCEARQAVPSPAPAGSFVSIAGITPTTDEPLVAGEKVQLSVKVAYVLNAESGTVALVVQDASGIVAMTQTTASKGTGNANLSLEFTVPKTTELQVFVPLGAKDQESTTTVAARTYKVTPK